MPDYAVPVLVFEGDYSVALVVKSLLEAGGMSVSFDGLPVGASGGGHPGSRVYVAREREAEARRLIAAGPGSAPPRPTGRA